MLHLGFLLHRYPKLDQNSHVWDAVYKPSCWVSVSNLYEPAGTRTKLPKKKYPCHGALYLPQDERICCTNMESTNKSSFKCVHVTWSNKKVTWQPSLCQAAMKDLGAWDRNPCEVWAILASSTNRKEADQLGEFGINGLWAQVISPQYTPFTRAGLKTLTILLNSIPTQPSEWHRSSEKWTGFQNIDFWWLSINSRTPSDQNGPTSLWKFPGNSAES